MTLFQALILGIVEGLTEFLPVSSTGHLILASDLLGVPRSEFLKSFEIFIQLGAILSVVWFYRKTLIRSLGIWKRVLAAFVPTAVIGFAAYKTVKTHLLGDPAVVVFSLFAGGVFIVLFERFRKPRAPETGQALETLSVATAIGIGLFQSIAIVPGVSRAAATVIGGLMLGMQRKTIVEFSFLLAVPTTLAAAMLDILKSETAVLTGNGLLLGVGSLSAFLVASVVIRFFLNFVQRYPFTLFGWYRIAAGAFFWWATR